MRTDDLWRQAAVVVLLQISITHPASLPVQVTFFMQILCALCKKCSYAKYCYLCKLTQYYMINIVSILSENLIHNGSALM